MREAGFLYVGNIERSLATDNLNCRLKRGCNQPL